MTAIPVPARRHVAAVTVYATADWSPRRPTQGAVWMRKSKRGVPVLRFVVNGWWFNEHGIEVSQPLERNGTAFRRYVVGEPIPVEEA